MVLSLGDGADMELVDEGDDVLGLYGIAAVLQGEPSPSILRDIAIANFGCAGTNGGTLGYDPESRSILLVRYWPIGSLDVAVAAEIVDLFAQTLLLWRARLEALTAGQLTRSSDTGPADSASLVIFA
jgi:hypothetical protein